MRQRSGKIVDFHGKIRCPSDALRGNLEGGTESGPFLNSQRMLLARIIHEYRREAFDPETRRSFSQVRPTQAYVQSVQEAEREKPRWTRG
jgi:hypothetical protein